MQEKVYNTDQNITQIFLASLSLVALFILYFFSQKEIEKVNQLQLDSLKLSYELRQSSDDLTRMVRTYVITGNPLYKKHYQEILEIRNGTKNRPLHYDSIYWDLVMLDDKRPTKRQKNHLSLLQRMENADFTQKEFAKLTQAKKNSDKLTKLEYKAMHLIEVEKISLKQRYKAIAMLHDKFYHQAKKSIMQPIANFTQLVRERTSKKVQNAQTFAKILLILLGLNILLLFFLLLQLKRISFYILGAPLQEIHMQLSYLGKGNFDAEFTSPNKFKKSIYALLNKTKLQLKELHKHNQQLSNLYALMSQCNQAIVHAKNQQELFDSICHDTVKFDGLELAWIALVNERAQEFDIVSVAGNASSYVKSLHLSINPNNPHSQGPAGQAYFRGEIQYFIDFQKSPKSSPWHTLAKEFSLESVAGIPLLENGKTVAVLGIYSHSASFFNTSTKKLLHEMNLDINFALDNFAKEARQKRDSEHIYQLANYDSLTNLANRSLFEEHFMQILNLSKRSKQSFALMFVDLDNFKEINDTLGHSIGDALLVEIATRFKKISREEDTVARQGGDEFLLLFPNTDAKAAVQIAQKLLELIEKPFKYETQELHTSISIGITIYPTDGRDLETLAKNADIAMYKAKDEGKNRYHFYTQSMHETSVRHLQLSNELHSAMQNNELEVYYQPQIATKSKKLIGAEALLRWKHPTLGFVPPDEFIPIAEANGLIIPIGEWVLLTATAQIKRWMQEGYEPMLIAVNISTLQFRLPDIAERIEAILVKNELSPEYLELELTERMAMKNPQNVIKTMNLLHEKGIKMSIDDFGTGYSSLSYLKKFQIYKLKIDQSFVRDITVDADDKAIVHSIISMAKGLGLTTIAEGVETIAQLKYLEKQGCNEIQGYYYSKPLPAKEFEAFRDNLNKLSTKS
jgi:diguanylate cyclase (GGDEF)-like protein